MKIRGYQSFHRFALILFPPFLPLELQLMQLEANSQLQGKGMEETLFLHTRPMLSSQRVHNGDVNSGGMLPLAFTCRAGRGCLM